MGHPPSRRSGNTLVITLFTIVMVIGLLSLASDHLKADRTLAAVDRGQRQAQFAAESFIALVERKLYNLAASSTANLKTNIEDQAGSTWFDFTGFDRGGTLPATTAIYLDGCALRWRVEPIKVMTRTQVPVDDASTEFFVNSERDPDLQYERRQAAGPNLIDDEAQHFYFRIAVESYVLKEPGDTTSVPWNESGRHVAMAQAQRVVQFEDVNAFRYLFNYVADSNTGDLEFHPGSSVTMAGGGLRSNQRILLSATNNVSYSIGTAVIPVPLEAPDGIYRLRKEDLLAAGNPDPKTVDPAGGAPNDTSTAAITVDGVALQTGNDSRTGLDLHHQAVRDGSEGREVHEDLDTFQAWNNGFLEPYWTVGPGVRLRRFASSNVYTIRTTDPFFHPGETSVETDLYATGLVQFRFPENPSDPNNTRTFTDIWPVAPDATTATNVYGLDLSPDPFDPTSNLVDPDTGLPRLPVPLPPAANPPNPVVVNKPRPGLRGLFEQAIGTNSRWATGLVIRERGRHRFHPGSPTLSANPNLSTGTPHLASNLVAFTEWMKANYVVYLGRAVDKDQIAGTDDDTLFETVDITDEFFAYSVSTAPTEVRDLLAHEDIFTNRREQAWFAARGLQATRANVLTLNLERLNAFLASVIPATSRLQPGRRYREYFNGLVYLERTPRPFKLDDPVSGDKRPYAHPLVTAPHIHALLPSTSPEGHGPFSVSGFILNSTHGTPGLAQRFLAPIVGTVDAGPMATPIHGTPGTWTVYPHQLGVRLDRATTLSRTMTFITPNTCYLWGDFNTSGGTPIPCAVYADQLIALSNAWLDGSSAQLSPPSAVTTTYRAAFVTHNVPTDQENRSAGGSGGVQNIMRFLENWSGATFRLHGCVVVPGRMRHCRAPINGVSNQTFHVEPTYEYTFNDALLTSGGQPPASLKTTRATRVMSSVGNGR
jgi:hypothetical protein